MSLAVTAEVTLGNRRYDSHAAAIEVTLGLLPALDTARVRLPARVEFDAGPGDPAMLVLDGGEGRETVLTGTIRSVRRGLAALDVVLADGGVELGHHRPNTTFDAGSAADVIRALADAAGIEVAGIDADLELAAYVASPRQTAAEHIAELAGLAGAIARFDGDGALVVHAWPTAGPDRMLTHGRELLACESGLRPGAAGARVEVGNGPAGFAAAPTALQHSLEPLPGDAEPGQRRRTRAVLRTPEAALTATRASDQRHRAADDRLLARCFLVPALRPGTTVSCGELPSSMRGGPWLLHRVLHRLDPDRGGQTSLHGTAIGGAGGGLLGALRGALGGLP